MSQDHRALVAPAPSRALLAMATVPTQLLGTLAFVLAVVWIAALGVRDTAVTITLVAGAGLVLVAGAAHRGSLIALAVCAAIDAALALALVLPLPEAVALVAPPFVKLSPTHLELACMIVGGVAGIAVALCIAAFPQAHEFGQWATRRRR